MKLRRFPHLARPSEASETDPLDLLRSLPPGEAQEAERFLQADHRAAAVYASHEVAVDVARWLSNVPGQRA